MTNVFPPFIGEASYPPFQRRIVFMGKKYVKNRIKLFYKKSKKPFMTNVFPPFVGEASYPPL